jgi:hypothetical protein
MLPTTIEEVIAALTTILDSAMAQQSRLGYFAALYRGVTIRVKEGIAAGRFEDGPRMERLDVEFANRYFEAYQAFRAGLPVTGCWRVAFEAASRPGPVILQHLLAGMNAHINLDLGIAAAEVAPGPALEGLRRDFTEINNVLFEMIGVMESRIGDVSPWIGLLDRVGGRTDAEIVRFNVGGARLLAWKTAETFAAQPRSAWPGHIARLDTVVETLGRAILSPGPVLTAALMLVRSRESTDVARVIEILSRPVTLSARAAAGGR